MSNNAAEQPGTVQAKVVPFFEEDTNTFSYVVSDPTSNACAIIYSVLDFDMASGTVDFTCAEAIIRYVEEKHLQIKWNIETHVHAYHL